MKHSLKALLIAGCIFIGQAFASDASEALLNADRALATQSRTIGFAAALSEAMAPNARKFDGGNPPAIGRESILALMAKYPTNLQVDWTPEEAIVARSGELGYTWGRYIAKSPNKKGELETHHGVYMDVWQRDGNGPWRWVTDMGVSTPAPEDKTADAPDGSTTQSNAIASANSNKQLTTQKGAAMAKVLGLGGIFFKSGDPVKLGEWYQKWLGMPYNAAQHSASLPIVELPPGAKTAWAPFGEHTTYFEPSHQPYMFNLIVDNLDQVLAQVQQGGGTLVGKPEDYPYGKFGWFVDPDGNKVELWELKAK
jgi:ketosteroid isomerase-like protein